MNGKISYTQEVTLEFDLDELSPYFNLIEQPFKYQLFEAAAKEVLKAVCNIKFTMLRQEIDIEKVLFMFLISHKLITQTEAGIKKYGDLSDSHKYSFKDNPSEFNGSKLSSTNKFDL
jgi:hypothetical protein